MKSIVRLVFATAAALVLLAGGAGSDVCFAQSSKHAARGPSGTAKKSPIKSGSQARPLKTLIFGEGSEIEGSTRGPDGEGVTARGEIIHSNLIRVRRHFLPEIYQSAERL